MPFLRHKKKNVIESTNVFLFFISNTFDLFSCLLLLVLLLLMFLLLFPVLLPLLPLLSPVSPHLHFLRLLLLFTFLPIPSSSTRDGF